MLKNFWYACEFSDRVKDKPVPLMLLGEKLVLYRTQSGKVACLRDRCAHRGDELSRGWVKDDCLHCPYHGWKYNTDGQCVHIPSNLDGQKISKKAKVNASQDGSQTERECACIEITFQDGSFFGFFCFLDKTNMFFFENIIVE